MKKLAISLAVIISLVFAGLLGWLFWLEYEYTAIVLYGAMIVALPFSVAMHELGHMLAGAICKIKAAPSIKISGASSCKLIPKTDKKLKWRLIFTARGGLIINLLLFLLGFTAFIPDVPVWVALFMPANIYLYILNAFSVLYAGGKSDGLVSWELYNNSDAAKVTLAVLAVQAKILKGEKIENIDKSLLFDLPQIAEDEEAFISLTELRYEYFKAVGDEEQAKKYKRRFEELKNEYID